MSQLRSVLPFYGPYRKGMALGLALVVVAQAFGLLSPWLIKLAIDTMGEAGVTRARIAIWALLIVGAALLGGAARYGMRELLNGISRRMEVDLRQAIFRHLLRMDAPFYDAWRTGDLMSRATNDLLAVRQAVGPAVMYLVNTAVGFVLALALMIWISPRLTLWAMVPMILLPPVVLGFGKVIHRRFERIQEQFSTLSTMVQENLTGVRIVRSYVQEDEQIARFQRLNADYRDRNMHLVKASGLFHPLLGLLTGFAMVIVLLLGGREVVMGRMSVGDYVAFFFYLAFLVWPMIALGWVVNLFQRGAASMARLDEILSSEPLVSTPADALDAGSVRGEITFRDVSFRYPGSARWVLRGVDLVARPGETVAIVGPTGSGKSTLVSLIPRLYDPTEGEVLLDGIPLTRWDPAALRRTIGVVPQDTFLFSETIASNIGLGLDGGHDAGSASPAEAAVAPPAGAHADPPAEAALVARVEEAARIAQLHESITGFPQGYRTLLGERGINLSGGQKQRAALARAVARDPRVLILDDALSAVDTQTEARILADLEHVMAGRTSFIISHRVSAVMHADQILVLDDGEIVERGTHTELIARGGVYARLLRRQLLTEQIEEGVLPAAGD